MSGVVTIGQLFDKCEGHGELWQCQVCALHANEGSGAVKLVYRAEQVCPKEQIDQAVQMISQAYGLRELVLEPRYHLRELTGEALELLRQLYSQRFPTLAPAFGDTAFTAQDGRLRLTLPAGWSFRVNALKSELEGMASSALDMAVCLELEEREDDGEAYEVQRQREMQRMAEEFAASQATAPKRMPEQKPPSGGKRDFTRKKNPDAKQYSPNQARNEDIIFGRPVARQLIKISDVEPDTGKTTVSGEIFSYEERKLNGRGKTVVSFEFYDGTGSLKASKVLLDEDFEEIQGQLKEGMFVTVQGVVNYSIYDRDNVITPSAIIKGSRPQRQDNAKEKRVELHLHTNMSAMDGLCDTKKVLTLAANMGHRAVAITDHGVAQAYPDAMNAARDLKKAGKEIKVLYGVEAYCVNDLVRGGVVRGYSECGLDGEIIVFDLETTGLRASDCEIIEIAADLVSGGQVRDRFHCYVKPRTPVPAEITGLTGITNDMVSGAEGIEAVLPRFLDFCGERPLCAHNASFDVGFLQAACEQLGIKREFCSIDTVELSRVLLPHLKKHKLNNLADEFGFTFAHHRADEDTDVLAKIFFKLLDRLKERCGIAKVSEINTAVQAIKDGSDNIKTGRSHHLIILVKTMEGLRQLYQMISMAHLKHFKRHPIIPMSMLESNRDGLILGSACEAGELFSAVVQGKPWSELVKIAQFYDFLEIQPLGNNRFMLEKGLARDEEQLRDFNRTIVRLGKDLNKPVCATGDVHFIEPEDALYREILMTGMGFDDASNQAPLYFKTTEEMLREFSYLGPDKAYEVVVTNPNQIADLCEEITPVPSGTYPPSVENSAEEIETMARTKAKELYGEELPQIVSDRLELELGSIIKHGFDVMYIIAQKLVAKSLEAGYLVGSRGSVGSSLVAYLTGITEVNALPPHYRCPCCKHSEFDQGPAYETGVDLPDKDCPACGTKMIKDGFDILFATFLGFEGDKAPDIDLNFSGEYQTQAHRETIKLFGEDHVYKAGTIGTVKDKTAYGFVKKYLEQKEMAVSRAEENRLVHGCTGIKRTTGQHPGGLIVVPQGRTIYEFCPVQRPADDPDSDIITTHFDYHSIHDNLLKLDLLGHDDPTMIRKLQDLSGMDPRTVPLDDPDTMKIFSSIQPLGIEGDDILGHETGAAAIPEFGTRFVRGMLEDTRPTTFEELLRISGLSHGTDVWLNNAKDIIDQKLGTLKDVIGVRDNITAKLMQMGMAPKLSFTISEAVRKGKGLKPEWEEEMRAHKLPEWYIESCKKIKYLFPRAHAVAYVMMAYRIAWFKVHKPLDFYSAYFSIRANAFDASLMCRGDELVVSKYRELKKQEKRTAVEEDMLVTLEVVHEYYKRGFQFAPMDVYQSDVKGFRKDGDRTLVPPLTSMPGVGEAAAQSIVDERQNGPFMSMEDLVLRCEKASKAVAENLEKAGALNGLPKSNQLDLFEAMGMM